MSADQQTLEKEAISEAGQMQLQVEGENDTLPALTDLLLEMQQGMGH
jgi:hypothetical protein